MLVRNDRYGKGARLKPHGEAFIEELTTQGYAKRTLKLYRQWISCFCGEFDRSGLPTEDMDGPTIRRLEEIVLNKVWESARTYARFGLGRFIDYLAAAGLVCVPELSKRQPTSLERLSEEYEDHLRDQRGLSEATIRHYLWIFKRFIDFRFGKTLGDLNHITPENVVDFLRKVIISPQPYRCKRPPAHLKSFFRFLFWSGKTRNNLANCIPRVAQSQPRNLPRFLHPQEIQRLLDSVKTSDAIGRRNYAMLLLAARLGLRGPEVVAIQLEDIDWRAGEILIRGKGKLLDRMPLPDDVGKAIVDYIQNGRAGNSRSLFVGSQAPYRPFTNAHVLNDVLGKAFEKTGLEPPGKYVGFHLLRHSLAVDMLRKGASLGEIADILRHRSRTTTMIYAKHNVDALRSLVCCHAIKFT